MPWTASTTGTFPVAAVNLSGPVFFCSGPVNRDTSRRGRDGVTFRYLNLDVLCPCSSVRNVAIRHFGGRPGPPGKIPKESDPFINSLPFHRQSLSCFFFGERWSLPARVPIVRQLYGNDDFKRRHYGSAKHNFQEEYGPNGAVSFVWYTRLYFSKRRLILGNSSVSSRLAPHFAILCIYHYPLTWQCSKRVGHKLIQGKQLFFLHRAHFLLL